MGVLLLLLLLLLLRLLDPAENQSQTSQSPPVFPPRHADKTNARMQQEHTTDTSDGADSGCEGRGVWGVGSRYNVSASRNTR